MPGSRSPSSTGSSRSTPAGRRWLAPVGSGGSARPRSRPPTATTAWTWSDGSYDLDAEPLTITAHRFVSPIVAGPDRSGPPADERIVDSDQVVAWLDAGDRLGVYDFSDDQYFSWIRSPRVVVRGERGEIHDRTVSWLVDHRTPASVELVRRDAGHDGNLEGFHLVGITLGDDWVYRNPFAPARLSDDEIAVASCLAGMAAWLDGGPDVCSLADAAQDHYLGLMIERAARTGRPVRVAGHVWDAPAGRRPT